MRAPFLERVVTPNRGHGCLRPAPYRMAAHVERLEVERRDPERVVAEQPVAVVSHEHPVERRVEANEDRTAFARNLENPCLELAQRLGGLEPALFEMGATQPVDSLRSRVPGQTLDWTQLPVEALLRIVHTAGTDRNEATRRG